MASVNLEVKAQVEDAVRALGRVNKSVDLMGKANQDAAGALGVFGVSLTALNNPLTLVAEGLKASIDKSIEWGNTIDDVQKITGQSAEETSKLVTVMGDFGVEANTLKGAAKALKEQGLTPNLETLKSLAKQYQSIQDPAARVAWGTKTLGRSFFDLSEILTKTPAEFDAVEKAAQASGKVIGQDFVDDMEQAQIKAKQLQDRFDGLLVKIGPPLIDTVSTAADSFGQLGMIWAAIQIKNQQFLGTIDDEQAALRAAAVAAGDLGAAFTEQEVPALEDVKRGTDDLVISTQMHSTTLETHAGKLADDSNAYETNNQKAWAAQGITSALAAATGELTTALIFSTASKGMDEASAIRLGEAMGVLNKETADAVLKIYDMKSAADTNHDGFISAAEAAGGYSQAIIRLGQDAAGQLQALRDLQNELNAATGGRGGRQSGATGDGYASGTNGWMTVPPGYNENFPIRMTSGERFAVVPPGRDLPGGSGAVINIDARGSNMSAPMIEAIVQRAWSEAAKRGDARARMRVA